MDIERYLRMFAGTFVMISLALGHWVSPYWYLFTAFVGLNLFQSSFTNKCPLIPILRKFGVKWAAELALEGLKSGSPANRIRAGLSQSDAAASNEAKAA
ncbi:MAG TPA: DUF2892 domain-containing protein [Terriglobales bacterium]|nr:DUF2892 domain-containing protein [Terriglobales bacterium]